MKYIMPVLFLFLAVTACSPSLSPKIPCNKAYIHILSDSMAAYSYIDTFFTYRTGDTICVYKIINRHNGTMGGQWEFSPVKPENYDSADNNFTTFTRIAVIDTVITDTILR